MLHVRVTLRPFNVTMGTLVDDPTIRPSAHIFVGSKAPWFTLTDDPPGHEEFG